MSKLFVRVRVIDYLDSMKYPLEHLKLAILVFQCFCQRIAASKPNPVVKQAQHFHVVVFVLQRLSKRDGAIFTNVIIIETEK